ncbi:MAG TPA: GNAT family N-acetyltransferase [Gammaproteobacteria bacterium]|jgi:GNAT superfamily N-acetyltransferase|nr:GNAT family N-acetyltransferase [Gammaproteobacteria bacterium]
MRETCTDTLVVRTGDDPDIHAFLAERIREFNAEATGYHDAESYSAVLRDETDEICAGISGFTWGGCCYVSYLWVRETLRGTGLGSALLRTVEQHARGKRCRLVLLSSHDFQAPDFYVRLGYEPIARIADYPVGHVDVLLAKRLDA